MRASLSTPVRAVNQITPYLGCVETRSSTATAARPLSRPWSQGHGSTRTSGAADGSLRADIPDVHPARPGNTSSMKRNVKSGLRFHRSKRFVITVSSGHCRCRQRTPSHKSPLSSVSRRLADEAKDDGRSLRRNVHVGPPGPFAFLPKQDDTRSVRRSVVVRMARKTTP